MKHIFKKPGNKMIIKLIAVGRKIVAENLLNFSSNNKLSFEFQGSNQLEDLVTNFRYIVLSMECCCRFSQGRKFLKVRVAEDLFMKGNY